MNLLQTNPFSVRTPEDLDAVEANNLFVDVFTDFYKLLEPSHSMLVGPRGCGKSMMFRVLLPDCQMLDRGCSLKDLPFFSVLVPIKGTDLNLTEMQRLVDTPFNAILNEHFLTMYITTRIFLTLSTVEIQDTQENRGATLEYVNSVLQKLRDCDWTETDDFAFDLTPKDEGSFVRAHFFALRQLFDELFIGVIRYLRRLANPMHGSAAYTGPLCGYADFLLPLVRELKCLSYMPTAPWYLLIDDADYLNLTQTKILNSWLAIRTPGLLNLKVSNQFRYKSYRTMSGLAVEPPHDYSEINVSDLYTVRRKKYAARVRQIVERRLTAADLSVSPEEFFPVDAVQEQAVDEFRRSVRESPSTSEASEPSVDRAALARALYIAGLAEKRAAHTYRYSGFEQLVHVSSGLVRYFLESAARMYSEEMASPSALPIRHIPPHTQDAVVREEANKLMYADFDRLFADENSEPYDELYRAMLHNSKVRLSNLVRALGGLFFQKLISRGTERRVFSFAVSDGADEELAAVFVLGVQFGYFHKSTIANKDGTGRTPLYILTRRLAPHFNLDPSALGTYVFLPRRRIKEAIADPDAFIRRIREEGFEDLFETRQLSLFE